MAKNNGHQNFTLNLGIPTPPPSYLGYIPKKKKQFFLLLSLLRNEERYWDGPKGEKVSIHTYPETEKTV